MTPPFFISQMPLRIGKISYVNCAPIFAAHKELFPGSNYEFVEGVPSSLNRLLSQGEIDLCPSSSIEYAQRFRQYYLLPGLSISSFGAVKSVLLFSRVPLEALDGAAIGLTAESDTSVNLLKIIFAEYLRYECRFERTSDPLPVALRQYPAVLLIGDEALRRNAAVQDLHVYDLGELWWRFTGLPFVFALWIADATAVAQKREQFERLVSELLRAGEHAAQNLERLAAASPEALWLGEQELICYWKTISYQLTPAHLEGVSTFFSLAVKHRLVPEMPDIRIFE